MKITSACIYALNIPFVDSFSHHLSERNSSDSIVVKVATESGVLGFGEGVPRSYVTGETQRTSMEHIHTDLLPQLMGLDLNAMELNRVLGELNSVLGDSDLREDVVWNASRAAVEGAVVDCICRSHHLSVNHLLPPVSPTVTYSGVISAGSVDKVKRVALQCKAMGFQHVKMKVSGVEDVERVATVRDIVGAAVSIRLDANGAFDPASALPFLHSVEKYDIACMEQPIPRGELASLAELRKASPIPLMADESLVTMEDARNLIEAGAVDYFNLRISKCGGLYRTLAMAELAEASGVGIQLGCQVGETAILSAAGRHLSAHLGTAEFVEGSYGTYLLGEDVSKENIAFGAGGTGSLLTDMGWGITVDEDVLDKYAVARMEMG
jgi:L-Ala-D/L-Glu epimerase / N-acetyl-D-glutamate racemase